MPQCAAFNCNVRSQKGVAMYLFPKDPKYRRIWVQNLRRDGFVVSDTSRLCSKHFTDDQFSIHPSVAKKCGYKKIDLKPNAVPTIFNFPKSETKTRRSSTAYFKRRALETFGTLNELPQEEPCDIHLLTKPSDDSILKDFSEVSENILQDPDDKLKYHAFTQTSQMSSGYQSISVQASPTTREIGIQVDDCSSKLRVPEDTELDDTWTDSELESEVDDSDTEWSLPLEDDDEEDEVKPRDI